VDKIAQDLRIVCSGHDESLLGPVVQYQLVGELAVLQRSLTAPIGVDVGDLADLYRLLGVLLAQGEPPPILFIGSRRKTLYPLDMVWQTRA
jgi:hypothetical protein